LGDGSEEPPVETLLTHKVSTLIHMDILGSTTPASLLASVASGVQTTGTDIWPLFILIGVPLAFVVYRFIVGAVKHTVGGKK